MERIVNVQRKIADHRYTEIEELVLECIVLYEEVHIQKLELTLGKPIPEILLSAAILKFWSLRALKHQQQMGHLIAHFCCLQSVEVGDQLKLSRGFVFINVLAPFLLRYKLFLVYCVEKY